MLNIIFVFLYIFVVLLFTLIPIILVCGGIARSIGRFCLVEIEELELDIERNARSNSDESYLIQLHC